MAVAILSPCRPSSTDVHLAFRCCFPGVIRPGSRQRGSSPLPAPGARERMGGEGRVSRSGAGAPARRIAPWKSPRGVEEWEQTCTQGSVTWKACPAHAGVRGVLALVDQMLPGRL